VNGWQSVQDCDTRDTTLGVYVADLPTAALRSGDRVDFTFFWQDERRWEGADFAVSIV